MHAQMKRLYEAAKKMIDLEGQSNVARYLGAMPQTVNNWEDRGISSEGLLTVQKKIGCDAIWLRDGTGTMYGHGQGVNLNDLAKLVLLYGQISPDLRGRLVELAETLSGLNSDGSITDDQFKNRL